MPNYDYDYGYDYVEITTSPRFGRSRSFTHHHNTRPPRCPPTCASVTREAWNALIARERDARAQAARLAGSLRASSVERRRLLESTRALQSSLDDLRGRHDDDDDDDDAEVKVKLRRRAAALREEVDVRDAALRAMRKARDLADVRVRELSQTVTDQGAEFERLRDEHAALRRAHERTRRDLALRTDQSNEAWTLVADLRRQLRGGAGARDGRSGFFRRPYGFG